MSERRAGRERLKAAIRSEVSSKDSKTKQERFHGEKTRRIPIDIPETKHVAVLKVSTGVTLAMGYQSVRMDIGVELPWPVRLKRTKDLRAGYDKAYEFLDREIVRRSRDLDELLRELVKKYR